MKHSIRMRLVLIVSVMFIVALAVIFVANIFLLPMFYETSKVSQMSAVYDSVLDICSDVDLGDESTEEATSVYDRLDSLSANSGVSVYVMQISVSALGTIANIDYFYPTSTEHLKNVTINQLGKYVRAMYFDEELDENYQLLEQDISYAIYKVYDTRIGSNYIELTGQLPDNYWLYMRANYTGIRDNASLSNRFLIYVGVVVLVISIAIIFFIATRYTRPILQLANWAKEMRGLNFSSRYEVDREDEIGVLGRSMNELSDQLEQTISDLKTANNELKSDIERKSEQESMRQEFLANVSHELKTPIALIQGYAEGLKENINDDPESREFYCDVIMDEADKMNKMVKNLLSLNQLEFGNNQIHIEQFDLKSVIEALVRSNEIRFEEKSISLKMDIDEDLQVWADEYMIEEVVTNYISNAINHTPNGGIIEIKSRKIGDKTRVSVFNTGEPIPDEDIDKIWIKFYKVDKARTRQYGGNGIGLSIVKAIMEAHNQDYGVINYDNGVEFWFEIDTVFTNND